MQQRLFHIDADVALEGEAPFKLAAQIFWSEKALQTKPVVFFCLPGGSMNRHYFNIQVPSDPSFSFAEQMTARGMLVVSIDHPGVGDSDRPEDGYAVTAEVIAQADANVAERIRSSLRTGELLQDLPPMPELVSVGVGHSMGGLITVIQQAERRLHRAIALLGFSDHGLPEFLPDSIKPLLGDPEAIRLQLPGIMRGIFPVPYPELPQTPEARGMFHGARSDRAGVEGLKAARDRLLQTAGYRSMIPGGVKAEMASIDVPVFLGLGDRDIAGPPHAIPASLPASGDITLFVQKEAGHSHFIFPSRFELFERLAVWSRMLAGAPGNEIMTEIIGKNL